MNKDKENKSPIFKHFISSIYMILYAAIFYFTELDTPLIEFALIITTLQFAYHFITFIALVAVKIGGN